MQELNTTLATCAKNSLLRFRCELWDPPKKEHVQLLKQFKEDSSVLFAVHQLRSSDRHLQLHQSFDVINPRCFPISVRRAKSLLHQVLLLPLNLHHALLHWVFHNELQQHKHTHKLKIQIQAKYSRQWSVSCASLLWTSQIAFSLRI